MRRLRAEGSGSRARWEVAQSQSPESAPPPPAALCHSEEMKTQLRFAYDLVEPLLVAPGKTIQLHRDFDPGYTDGMSSKAEASARLSEGIALLADYQDRLSAQDTVGVLFILSISSAST